MQQNALNEIVSYLGLGRGSATNAQIQSLDPTVRLSIAPFTLTRGVLIMRHSAADDVRCFISPTQ